jgi:DNA-directed RNA polymerase subunit RPC12/RpoP
MHFRSPGEVYFRCSACRGRLAAERVAAGRLVECPACRSSLLVPEQSTAWPPALRRFLWIVATHGLAIVLLTGLGVYLLTRNQAETWADAPEPLAPSVRRAAAVIAPAPASERPGVAEGVYTELQTSHQALGRKYEELANWVLTNMRGRFLLKEKFVKNVQIAPLSDEYLLSPDIADFLNIQPQEQALLEDALGFGLSSLAVLEAKYISVTQSTPDRVAVHIPSYVEEGASMQDDLYRAMETVLGAQRFSQLLTASEKELAKRYHYFGKASRTMVFQKTAAEKATDAPYLVIRDGWIMPDGVGKRSIQVEEASVRDLPRDYLPYLSWLPEFVAAYAQP